MEEDALRALHAGRAYHGWPHVEALLALWWQHRAALRDPKAVGRALTLSLGERGLLGVGRIPG